MSKLLKRLSDAGKSGVYRVGHDHAIREVLTGSAHQVATVELAKGKDAMIASIADALGFPAWFGGNWDALEDCLTDLSWHPAAAARVILFMNPQPGDDFGILLDVLQSVAEFWRGRGQPFFSVFVDPEGMLALPALHAEKSR